MNINSLLSKVIFLFANIRHRESYHLLRLPFCQKFSRYFSSLIAVLMLVMLPFSAAQAQIIIKAPNTITLTSVPASITAGNIGIVQATATSGQNVSFSSLTPGICSVTVGIGFSVVTGIAPGYCILVADEPGNIIYNPAPSVQFGVYVLASQSITFGAAPAVIVGGTGSVTALTGASLNPVNFSSTTPSTCSVSGSTLITNVGSGSIYASTVSGLAAGSCSVQADEAGNGTYGATTTTQTFTIGAGSQTIVFGTAPTILAGGTGTVTATGGASGNPVTFSSTTTSVCTVSGNTITGVSAGTCALAANQAGNVNYNAATQVTQSFAIGKGNQVIVFGTAPTVIVGGTGTASATGGASGNPVTFSSTTTSVCTVSGNTITGVSAGTCTLAANQAGNLNYNAATQVTQSFAIGKGNQAIVFGTAPTVIVGGTGTASATGGASGNPVTFSSTTPTVCGVNTSTGVVTGITAGTNNCVITANQAANVNYNAAPQVSQTLSIGKGSQTISFGVSPTVIVGGTGSVSATATSGLSVTYSTASTDCSVNASTGVISGLKAGTNNCVITANQAGNVNYTAALQVSLTLSITNPPPLILSGPNISYLSDTSAVIEWVTDVPSDTRVFYTANPTNAVCSTLATAGFTSGGLDTTPNAPNMATHHSYRVSPLTAATAYCFFAQSMTSPTNGSSSINTALTTLAAPSTTDTQAPVFTFGPVVTAVSGNTATIEWTTNKPAIGSLVYAPPGAGSTTINVSSYALHQKVKLTGLTLSTLTSPSVVYNLQVTATDTLAKSVSSEPLTGKPLNFTTPLSAVDTTAPKILGVPRITDVTDTQATVTWTTDKPTNSNVTYSNGTTFFVMTDGFISPTSTPTIQPEFSTTHSARLTGLTQGAAFSVNVTSLDASGNTTPTTPVSPFTASLAPRPPVILSPPDVSQLTNTSALIHWLTDVPSDSVVNYGTTAGGVLNQTQSKGVLETDHSVILSGLTAGMAYSFQVQSRSAATSLATSGLLSPPSSGTFTTLSAASNPPAFVACNTGDPTPNIIFVGTDRVTFEWCTDQPTDASVTCTVTSATSGTSNPISNPLQVSDLVQRTRHQITITNVLFNNLASPLYVTKCQGRSADLQGRALTW